MKILVPENIYFLPFKDLEFYNKEIEYKARVNEKEYKIDLIITCKNFVKGIHITWNSDENFSESFFDFDCEELKKVSIYLNQNEPAKEILKLRDYWGEI